MAKVDSIFTLFTVMYILLHYTDSQCSIDAVTTALYCMTWMLARKKIEHWLVWVVVDAISMGLFIFKELYPTTLLFFVYTVLAIYGYAEWKKDLIPEAEEGRLV